MVCDDMRQQAEKNTKSKNGKDREEKRYGPNSGAEVERFPGVTTFAVVQAAKTEELKEVQKYL